MRAMLGALVVTVVTACAAGTPAADPPPPAASTETPRVISPGSSAKTGPHDAALARVRALVGEPTCAADNECRSLAVGHRACGGPTGYVAWSTTVTDAQALAAASKDEQRTAAEQSAGTISICAFLADPGARCVAGRCQTARPATTAPGAQ